MSSRTDVFAAAAGAFTAAAVALCLAAAPASAARQMPTIVQDDRVMLRSGDADFAVLAMRRLGVDWLRITAGWSVIAPQPGSDTRPNFDATNPAAYPPGAWIALDRAVKLADAQGLSVSIDIAFWAPRWAVRRRSRDRHGNRWGINMAEYAQFAEAVARRYSGFYRPPDSSRRASDSSAKPRQVPQLPDSEPPLPPLGEEENPPPPPRPTNAPLPRAVSFQIWNEPNYPSFFLPQFRPRRRGGRPESPHLYRRMVSVAYPRIKRVAPFSLVLIGNTSAGGLSAPRKRTSAMAPLLFLRTMACVNRRLRPIRRGPCARFDPIPGDGWAHHPYSNEVPPWKPGPGRDNARFAHVPKLGRLLSRLHARGRIQQRQEVWLNEYGYQTNPPDPTQRWSPMQQARFLSESELVAWLNPRIKSFAQFPFLDGPKRDGPGRLKWRDFQSGLLTARRVPKPAATAFRYSFVPRARRGGRIRFWGHVRPGRGTRYVRVTRRRGGDWQLVPGTTPAIATDADGYFVATGRGSRRSRYRMEVATRRGWNPGLGMRPTRRR